MRFNIRVYGLFINDKGEILLADEERFDIPMTKFPGGGLQFGEGTIDCLKRECYEELGQEIEVLQHYYTTDFFQKAFFAEKQQLISIYYIAAFRDKEQFRISTDAFDFSNSYPEKIAFRYYPLAKLDEGMLSFPVDKYVLSLLKRDTNILI